VLTTSGALNRLLLASVVEGVRTRFVGNEVRTRCEWRHIRQPQAAVNGNFDLPGKFVTSPTFGQIVNASPGPIIQFALKIYW
jgi:hypothetical protein